MESFLNGKANWIREERKKNKNNNKSFKLYQKEFLSNTRKKIKRREK